MTDRYGKSHSTQQIREGSLIWMNSSDKIMPHHKDFYIATIAKHQTIILQPKWICGHVHQKNR